MGTGDPRTLLFRVIDPSFLESRSWFLGNRKLRPHTTLPCWHSWTWPELVPPLPLLPSWKTSHLVGYSGVNLHVENCVFSCSFGHRRRTKAWTLKNVFLSASLHLCQSISSRLILHHEVAHVQNPYNLYFMKSWLVNEGTLKSFSMT